MPDDLTTIYKKKQLLVAVNLIPSNVDELTVSFQQLGAESPKPSPYGDPNVCLPDLGGLEDTPWLQAVYPFPQSLTLPRVLVIVTGVDEEIDGLVATQHLSLGLSL